MKTKSARKTAARSSKSKPQGRAKPVRAAARKATVAPRKAAAKKASAKGKPAKSKPLPKGKASVARATGKNGKAAPAAAVKKPARVRVRMCKAEDCQSPQTTQGYCRLHYLANWKALREEKLKRAQKNLDRYVERMAGAKKPAADEEESEGGGKGDDAVFEEDFGEFVDVLSREENLDKILNGIKVEDY